MNNRTLPENLSIYPQLYALDILIEDSVREIPQQKLLIQFIDTVPVEALEYIAEELNVLGLRGWDFADTETKKRDLLKNAIRLKRYAGTPWAVEEAMRIAGYDDFELQENSGAHWATFRIYININAHAVNVLQIEQAKELVHIYKGARNVFEGFFFNGLHFDDEMQIDDELLVNGERNFADSINTSKQILRNGTIVRNGTQNYSTETDTIRIKIV